MIILPAIDLIAGQCVRLTQGDYEQVSRYDISPIEKAVEFITNGARGLHIVDLDGARAGYPVNSETVCEVATLADIPVQIGGGIRTACDAKRYLEQGIDRVILGTAAIEDPDVITALIDDFGSERLVVSLDHKAGAVATRGWFTASNATLTECATALRQQKVRWVVLTDIARDGMLTSVSPEQLQAIAEFASAGFSVIAAGGVTTLQDIAALKKVGATATIIGKALYEGRLNLVDCIATAS